MDMPLKREFVFTYRNEGDNKINQQLLRRLQLMENDMDGVLMTEHSEILTIVCHSLGDLSEAVGIAMKLENEGPSQRFVNALQKSLVEFIG